MWEREETEDEEKEARELVKCREWGGESERRGGYGGRWMGGKEWERREREFKREKEQKKG